MISAAPVATAACVALAVAGFIADSAHAQFGVPWRRTPTITIISAAEGDPRASLVDEAVLFWNKTLDEIGSSFRLGSIDRRVQPVPKEALQQLSRAIIGGQRPIDIPEALRNPPGDITIMLADSGFVSFAGPFDLTSKRVIGIRGLHTPPLNLPNVARNVITHELGHAIGLLHNDDPTKLMCGRPASCRPDLFRSDDPRIFPLTDDEKRALLKMYPAAWIQFTR